MRRKIKDPEVPPPKIVTRDKWGALPPTGEIEELIHPIDFIWFRETPAIGPCLKTDKCSKIVQELQKRDMLYAVDIHANFLVADDGMVYEGRGWNYKPESCELWNKYDGKYIEIAYIGPFNDIPEPNAQKILNIVYDLISHGSKKRLLVDVDDVFLLGDPPHFLKY